LHDYARLEKSPNYYRAERGDEEANDDGGGEHVSAELRLRDYQLEGKGTRFSASPLDLFRYYISEWFVRDIIVAGVNWLLWNWWHKRPCILAVRDS